MKKTIFTTMLAVFAAGAMSVSAQWAPAGDRIKTKWAEQIDVNNVLPEYPRPQMTRSEWKNLNGLWDYSVVERGRMMPENMDGKILVPFAIESSLSGVQKRIKTNQEIWYDRTFDIPSGWRGKDIILHFGAVDWKAEVYVNDILVGTHTNGYVPFSFNITPYLNGRGSQKLSLRVSDPTEDGYQARGKQANNPSGIWYTPVSGIWQTVWMEPVAKSYITNIKTIPNLDANSWAVTVDADNTNNGDIVEVEILDGNTKVASGKGVVGSEFNIYLKDPKLWSPESPFLYNMKVSLVSAGRKVDEVGSYTAMRKISRVRQGNHWRMALNNKPLFHFGPLDQGWWPDGLYTPPTDEAMLYDIKVTKDLGFNMIRKHVKVESARWFYHCDREGILVWQDMPNGDRGSRWDINTFGGGQDAPRSAESKENYYKEWKEIMDFCMSFPSVVVWVPFNEAWGQFDTYAVADWTKKYDPSRLVNAASGGNHTNAGDISDNHDYPNPKMALYNGQKINVLGEYGGIGYFVQGHVWDAEKGNWGYGGLKQSVKEVTDQYVTFTEELIPLVKNGYSGAVYTQTTDVEGELNGFMTYDRSDIKMDVPSIKAANQKVIKSME